MVKVRYNGESDELTFIDGNVYEVQIARRIGNEIYYGIVDEVGDRDLCAKDGFTFVEGSEEDLPLYEEDEKTHKLIRIK